MNVKALVLGPYEMNCYLYWDDSTKTGVVIDPGDEFPRIQKEIERIGFTPKAILLTHGHVDHIGAVGEMKNQYDIPIYIGKGEEHLLVDPQANLSAWSGVPVVSPPADKLLRHNDTLTFDGVTFQILSTPGHSPASICYYDKNTGNLFCGDALFNGSIGRTDFPGCSLDVLLKSIEEHILSLPDTTICFPGHGPTTTVGAERKHNPFLLGRYHG